jgi:phosphoserine phosphatase
VVYVRVGRLYAGLLAALLALQVVPLVVLAQTPTVATPTPCEVLRARVAALRDALTRVLTLNVSEGVRANATALLGVDVGALNCTELRSWAQQASRVLASAASELREGRAYAVGVVLERYLNGLRRALENHVRRVGPGLNVSVEEVLSKLARARDFAEVVKSLRELEARALQARARALAEALYNRSITGVWRGYGAVVAASAQVGVAERVLNRILERLRELGVPGEVVERLELAVAKLREVGELLRNVSRELATLGRERIEEAVNRSVARLAEKFLEDAEELRQELLELRSRAAGANLTEVVAAIDRLLQKLGEVENRTAEEPDARRWMPDLLEVKAWLQVIRARLGEVYKQVPVAAVDKTFESVVGKAEELLKEVREIIEFLRKKSREIVCAAVYPPPPVCAVLQELPKLLEWAENATKEAEAALPKAREAYGQGRKAEALLLANRALATLTVVRARLEPVYGLVKQATEGPAVTPGPRVSATATIESLGGARYRLTLGIRNEGSAPVEVDRVTVVVTPAIELRVRVSVAPGEARTVTLQFSVNPIQLTQLRASKTVAVLVHTSAGDVIAVNATVK